MRAEERHLRLLSLVAAVAEMDIGKWEASGDFVYPCCGEPDDHDPTCPILACQKEVA